MNSILSEKEYQNYFLEKLQEQGYEVRSSQSFDRFRAIDEELLFRFLEKTQPDEIARLRKIYKDQFEETLLNRIQQEERDPHVGRLGLLKDGLELSSTRLSFMFTKPATDFNQKLTNQYSHNIFSVMEEVPAGDKERVDVVTFVNGFAVTAFELKCNTAGQGYKHAIRQFREERSPKTPLFGWRSGALVCFAMDLEEVYMTTRLAGEKTAFLPFNMGRGDSVYMGAGNPVNPADFDVSYMWEDILAKDTMLEIISKFMFLETTEKIDPDTGKKTTQDTIIFPRYHQLDAVRKILADVREHRTDKNYLIQHSAGSGKTNTLAWLAHRFASLHDAENRQIFDNIIICTDRVVVDRQLQRAVLRLENKFGTVTVMDENCTSEDLAKALNSRTKIIATTIQKFPYILDSVRSLKGKNFAVIIDEAHSSTAGKNMMAVTRVLGADRDEIPTMEDLIESEITGSGKQSNVSMFAFTATPKATTIDLFGQVSPKGVKEPFHIYSMKQAIEEGFILDVLQNYTTYDTLYKLNKLITDDPQFDTQKAKRQIFRFVQLDPTNIQQRVEIIIEHFRTSVRDGLGGTAKAMVVTDSRAAAVKYQKAFEEYTRRKGYDDIRSLVAFSGKVKLEDGSEYSEPQMNGFTEKSLPAEFDKDENNVLIVADKYQTGFDQKKLCAMYILKSLKGINAVQTLSRLNRVVPGQDKQTFILDFANDYDEIEKAFSKYYTVTFLSNSVTPGDIHELLEKIRGYDFLDEDDVEQYNELLYGEKPKNMSSLKQKMTRLLEKAKRRIDKIEEQDGEKAALELRKTIRHFLRFYQFLMQATCYQNSDVHKHYNFLDALNGMLRADDSGPGFDLKNKVAVAWVQQKKKETHEKSQIKADPALKLPKADRAYATEDNLKKLSEIIREINVRNGSSFDEDVSLKAVLQVKDILLKSDALRRSAKSNDFESFNKFAVGALLDEALADALDENYEFFRFLLANSAYKKKILNIFTPEIFRQLKSDAIA